MAFQNEILFNALVRGSAAVQYLATVCSGAGALL